jgi:hypothetical protein
MHPIGTYHLANAIHADRERALARPRRGPKASRSGEWRPSLARQRRLVLTGLTGAWRRRLVVTALVGAWRPSLARQRRLVLTALILAVTLSVGTAIAAATPIPQQHAPTTQSPL